MSVLFLPWERDPHVAKDTDSIWTSALIVGDGDEDFYDICVVGEPGHDGRASWDVTGVRNGESVTFASYEANNFEQARDAAMIAARRASIRTIR